MEYVSMTTGSDVPGCKPLGLSVPILRPSDHDGSTQQQAGEHCLVCHFVIGGKYIVLFVGCFCKLIIEVLKI